MTDLRKPSTWKVGTAAILLPILGLGSACGSGGSEATDRKLVVAAPDTRTPTFGPWSQSTHSDGVVESLLFSNLVKVGPDGRTVRPDLATKWKIDGDGRIYTFTLRKGVEWSDGEPFTANDVVFTITQAAHFGPAPYVGFQPLKWLEVKGADKIKGTNKPLPGVEALDRHTVRITLAKPDATFLSNIASGVYSIVPKHMLTDATAKNVTKLNFSTKKPVGTGPYTLTKYVPNQYLKFSANRDYFRGRPKIDTIYYQTDVKDSNLLTKLQSGDIQMAFNLAPKDSERVKEMDGIKGKFVTSPGAEFLQFRVDNPRVADPRVRQAFYYAIDRRKMLSKLFDDHGEIRWTMPGFDQSDPSLDKYPYDPAKAKKLLKAADFDFSKPFKLLYSPEIDPLWPRMAPVVQRYLKDIGVKFVLNPVDSAKWESAMTSPKPTYALTFQAGGSMGLGPDRSAPYFQCKSPVNTMYADCDLTRMYKKAGATLNKSKQKAVYAKIARELNQKLPYATLWQTDQLHAYSKQLGGGFRLYSDWQQTFFDVQDWTLG